MRARIERKTFKALSCQEGKRKGSGSHSLSLGVRDLVHGVGYQSEAHVQEILRVKLHPLCTH